MDGADEDGPSLSRYEVLDIRFKDVLAQVAEVVGLVCSLEISEEMLYDIYAFAGGVGL